MPQYHLAAAVRADELEARAGAFSATVTQYIQRADNYTLAVVLFASALFFAGISTRMRSPGQRVALLVVGYMLLLGTVAWLATFPVTIAV